MKLYLVESGGQHVIVAAEDDKRAREICALEEMHRVAASREQIDETDAEELPYFVEGWHATELVADADEGIQMAWWSMMSRGVPE